MFSEDAIIKQSLNLPKLAEHEPSVERVEWTTLGDSNRGSYATSVVDFNLPSASTSSAFMDLARSYVTLPMVHVINGSTDLGAKTRMLAPVSANQLISSFRLSIDNNTVVSDDGGNRGCMTMSDFHILTQCTPDDVAELNAMNWFKDTPGATNYVAGIGCIDSNVVSALETPALTAEQNKVNFGQRARLDKAAFDPAGTNSETAKWTDSGKTIIDGRSHVVEIDAQTMVYHQNAILPLRFLHEVFRKIGLNKGLNIKLSLSINTSVNSFLAVQATDTVTTLTASSRFGTSPVLASYPEQSWQIGAANSTVTVTSSIYAATVSGVTYTNAFGRPAEIHLKYVHMRPEAERAYLNKVPSQIVQWNEVLHHQIKSVVPASTTVARICTSIPKCRYLVVKPVMAASTHGATNPFSTSGGVVSVYDSVFASNMLTAPHCALSDIRIKINNQNLFPEPLSYSYENFIQNMRRFAPEGNYNSEFGRFGMISYDDWMSGMRYYVFDLTQAYEDEAQDSIAKDVIFQFVNNSRAYLDVDCYLMHEQQRMIDTATGAVTV